MEAAASAAEAAAPVDAPVARTPKTLPPGERSKIIHISHLKRPFTISAFKALLQQVGINGPCSAVAALGRIGS